jgi:thermostable 8-oxoguanine DNA glycosylase
MQEGFVWNGSTMIRLELPLEHEEVIPGVRWGSICAFPSPAYWKYQVLARQIQESKINNRLGRSLAEEVGACLLGGHGIPASVGLAAFEHLKQRGTFSGSAPKESDLLTWLGEPIKHGEKTIRYRFAKQKARYLTYALSKLEREPAPIESGRKLRDWLLDVPGIGYKTASWIARNWLDADDVAILDIHVLRAGLLGGFFREDLTVERHYLWLEEQFIALSHGLGVRASELDAVIWQEMMSSPYTVHKALGNLTVSGTAPGSRANLGTKNRQPNTDQMLLIV